MSTSTLKESQITTYKTFDDMPIFTGKDGMRLLQGILLVAKFVNPSPIQQRAIVPLAEGNDIIAQSQSGTGKTGTFVIGTISRIDHSDKKPQAIIVAHTHELAEQIGIVISEIGAKCGTIPCVCVGGQDRNVIDNMRAIGRGCHVLVGTPGRLKDLIRRKAFKLSNIKIIVLDEADKLLSKNFRREVGDIMESIDKARNAATLRLQIGIFSATFPESIVQLAMDITQDPIITLIPQEEITLKDIKQYKIEAGEGERIHNSFNFKADLIVKINQVKTIPQSIIYVNNISSAERLHDYLDRNGMITEVIHGKVPTGRRHQIIKDFRTGNSSRILISTDLLARGFDSQYVMLVINFDLPRVLREVDDEDGVCKIIVDEERISEYIHRIGRSGRFNRKGVALNFVTNSYEKTWLETIESFYEVTCEDLPEELDEIF